MKYCTREASVSEGKAECNTSLNIGEGILNYFLYNTSDKYSQPSLLLST